MKTYIYKNTKTGETKPSIKTMSLVLADEYFCCTYHHLNNDWVTEELKPVINNKLNHLFDELKEHASIVASGIPSEQASRIMDFDDVDEPGFEYGFIVGDE